MTLEQEIKSKFRNDRHKAVVNIMYTNNWLCSDQLRVLQTQNLTFQQFNVLRILRGQYPNIVRINDIIERMLDKMSNVSRLVDKLVEKRLVQRTTSPIDRRAVDVIITQAGLDFLAELDPKTNAWEDRLDTLSEDELKTLNNLLDKLRSLS